MQQGIPASQGFLCFGEPRTLFPEPFGSQLNRFPDKVTDFFLAPIEIPQGSGPFQTLDQIRWLDAQLGNHIFETGLSITPLKAVDAKQSLKQLTYQEVQ